MDDDGSFEEVYENDDGEDLYLQKIAKNKQKQVPDEEPKEPEPHESSRKCTIHVYINLKNRITE